MAVTKNQRIEYEMMREHERAKKMKPKKLDKKIKEAFSRINNKVCYDFFEDEDNKTYHNALNFLSLIEKKCEEVYGLKSKYKKSQVQQVMESLFPYPTEREIKTIEAVDKALKKCKTVAYSEFRFNGLMKGKHFVPTERKETEVDRELQELESYY